MREVTFTTSFAYSGEATVHYTYYALRHLPFTVLMNISVTAKRI